MRNKVVEPAGWVSNIVLVEKPNKQLRICLDPKALNEYIQDNLYEIPSFEDIRSKCVNKKVFSVFDLKDGYCQIKLNAKSKKMCTCSTPFGCYRFKRLPFGIRIATEANKMLMEKVLSGINGLIIYIDDLLIVAENEKSMMKL